MALSEDAGPRGAQAPARIASKEGILLASIALYGIFYLIITPWGFSEKLEDPDLFKYYSLFFLAAFIILLVTALILIFQRPAVLKNEWLGLAFFLAGALLMFVLPYSLALEMDIPLPDLALFGGGGVLYAMGIIIFIRNGGFFSAWLVGSMLTVALAGHEAMGIVRSNGFFGPYDMLLWSISTATLLISFSLFLVHMLKVRIILAPIIERGNAARRARRYDEALREFDRALKWYPTFTTALNNKGNVLFNMGKYAESKECYRKALDIDPYYANARRNLTIVARRT